MPFSLPSLPFGKTPSAPLPTPSINEEKEDNANPTLDSFDPISQVATLPTSQSWQSDESDLMSRRLACEVMARSIFTFASTRRFFSDREDVWNGVALRLAKGDYAVCPPTDPRLDDWRAAVAVLNCEVSIQLANKCQRITLTARRHLSFTGSHHHHVDSRRWRLALPPCGRH